MLIVVASVLIHLVGGLLTLLILRLLLLLRALLPGALGRAWILPGQHRWQIKLAMVGINKPLLKDLFQSVLNKLCNFGNIQEP